LLLGVEPFYVLTYLIGGTVAAGGIAWKVIRLIQKIDRRGKNQNKAFVILANHSDDETDRLHPERSEHHITETIETVLQEDD